MAFDMSNVQGLSVVVKKNQNVVLLILKVPEHDNQPELEHGLLSQYVIDTGEHDGNVCFFRNDFLQYETAIRNMGPQLRPGVELFEYEHKLRL